MFCVGNSHMACVLVAAEQEGISVEAVVLKESRYFEGLSHRMEFIHPRDLGQLLARKDAKGPVFSFIGGTRHAVMRFQDNPRPYDVYLPSAPALPVEEGAEIIPFGAMRLAFAASMEKHLRAIRELISRARGPLFHFEPPPPPSIQWWEGTKHSLEDAAPYLRFKLWSLNSEIIREVVEQGGGTFVESPAEAIDDDGLLRAEFVGNATHANPAYGALVLEQMRQAA